jgi:hypothetical protein
MGKAKMLKELKNIPATRRQSNSGLTPRAQVVLALTVYGLEEPDPDHPNIPAGKPVGAYQIAELLGVRRRYVHNLFADATFKTELAAALAKRQAYAAKAIDRIGEIISSPNETAALNASKAILGEDVKAPAVSVTVNNQSRGSDPTRLCRPVASRPPSLTRRRVSCLSHAR